jgi:hypothetical protein
MGLRTNASGTSSTAMGSGTAASGNSSIAMGTDTIANGHYSIAMGTDTTASGTYSTAIGLSTVASGGYSLAMGTGTTASGDYSIAIGDSITSNGTGSVAIGLNSAPYVLNQSSTMSIMGGRVGIGTLAPNTLLYVNNSNDGDTLTLEDSSGICTLDPDSGGATFACTSDIRLKTNVKDAKEVLPELMKLKIRDYNLISNGEKKTGVIAQEVMQVKPELVSTGSSGYLMVSEISSWQLVKAIQELKTENDGLKSEIKNLQDQVSQMKELVCLNHPEATICN